MTQSKTLSITTKKQFELVDITAHVTKELESSSVKNGVAVIYSPHTTAGIRLNHNEPLLIQDLMKMLYRLVPIDANYSHDLFEMRSIIATNERSNGHAHVKAFLLGSSESIPVVDGKLTLGDKQSIFFVELDGGRSRNFIIQIVGEK